MPAPLVPWQWILLPAVVLWIAAGTVIGLAVLVQRRHPLWRARVAALASTGILLVALSTPIGLMAYRQYVAINTRTYGYALDVYANGTGNDAIVVPIPGDETLVSGLDAVSGVANWSIINTRYGRGLYVAFAGNASLHASYSAYGDSRFDHNWTPTMLENSSDDEADVWIFHATGSDIRVDLSIEWCRLDAYPSIGWRTYYIECFPPP